MIMGWKDDLPGDGGYFETGGGVLYHGDVLSVLKRLPSESVDCIITSPPYWALRDYGDATSRVWGGSPDCEHEFEYDEKRIALQSANDEFKRPWRENASGIAVHGFCVKCGAWYGQLGLEPTFNMYLEHLWMIFDEAYRVLKKTGTLWVNLGDTYYGGGKGKTNGMNKAGGIGGERFRMAKYPQKSLLMIPERFAIGMIERGWILRNQIIWHKPNAMPASVKDRFTVDFEKIFFFTKQKKYYFEQVREPLKHVNANCMGFGGNKSNGYGKQTYSGRVYDASSLSGRNKRTVWTITTKPFKEAHFAVFPPDLVETPIRAGCPESGIVLDPFMGSGTTAIVAERLGRKWVGVELNPEYCEIAKRRILSEHQNTPLTVYTRDMRED